MDVDEVCRDSEDDEEGASAVIVALETDIIVLFITLAGRIAGLNVSPAFCIFAQSQ